MKYWHAGVVGFQSCGVFFGLLLDAWPLVLWCAAWGTYSFVILRREIAKEQK